MRKYLTLLILLMLVVITAYNYLYQAHRNIETETPEFVVSSQSLFQQFAKNPSNSEIKYLNKTIDVSGVISEVNKQYLVLNDNIFCKLEKPHDLSNLAEDRILIRGRLIGYDDLLNEIKLDQCVILKQFN
ncbi:MAG: hypothetical protein P8K68_12640 [Algibacter sp.]|uniref:OB-fold protein n=1 Tax=Algibacter sp. TaxID=1872428 RepID=UPI002621139A|nr:hypothetical protein [Algibacter sp.]MDG1728627.1 hypothetical protein [Algibacter sp.]MDG2179612.1 hypothetical protein [Algibacter sp.]